MKQTDDKYNIIWFGSVYSASGYGAVTRPYILGLINAGINVKVVPSKRASVDKTKLDRNDVKVLEHAENAELIEGYRNILILQTAPSEWADLDIVGADYVIGQTVFETDVIPRDWLRICNSGIVDEIWLPTKFNMKSFKRVKNADTVHMPYCFDMDYYRKFGNTRKYRPFRVLYIADFTPRKNIALLIEAFRQEFGSAEQIELYIHTTSLYRQDELESFRELNNINCC
ncbi:hypothetical protein M1590_04260, partial [Candidatus Marsarchaeota archaeon]|nr:hypothetical protein [Candidatus Marsarchaeota archaeon]